jgi:hypothetical protein
MPVPSIIFASPRFRKPLCGLLVALSFAFVTNRAQAKGPAPAMSIPLEPLGFQNPQTQFMLAGSSMMTVDFVDPNHLLLTYGAKRLLKRLPDCPPADQDRVVEAVLLELPSGKALARTSWRTHDHGQYLWNLGRGRFMLRLRDTLTTFAPMVNLPHGDAFVQRPFIRADRRIGAILLSPDSDLMVLETLDPKNREEVLGDQHGEDDTPVQINFFRLISLAGDDIDVRAAGVVRSRVPGRIPANAAGYIAILDEGRQRWSFDFKSYGGKTKELAGFNSTCRPSPILVSGSEFIAFGCHASHTPQVIAAFNLRGEEMWEQNMTESYVSPSFSYAPGSGRFAISRVLTHAAMVETEMVSPEVFDSQLVTVYQTDSGRQLLRIDAAPIARAGQNFSLSPDGMRLAIIRDGALEVYNLPPLTKDEQKAVQMAEASTPQIDGDPAMLLSASGAGPGNSGGRTSSPAQPQTGASADAVPSSSTQAQAPAPPVADSGRAAPAETRTAAGTAEAAQQDSGSSTNQEGDAPEQRRRPPTLYAPGENHGGDPAHRDDPR